MGGTVIKDEYDVVIDFEQITTGKWPIAVSSERWKEIEPLFKTHQGEELLDQITKKLQINSNRTVISIQGLFNRGKTWIANKLCGTSLPSDFKVTTRGLSFMIPKTERSRNWIILDTAGTNSPVSDLADDSLVEKKISERLLQDLVFELSDIMIIVVNELTWPDQEYLHALHHRLATSSKTFKQLFVIHNFMVL